MIMPPVHFQLRPAAHQVAAPLPSAYPLAWPKSLPRNHRARRNSQTYVSLHRSVSDLQDSLRLLASDTGLPVSRIVVSSSVTLGNAAPEDPGVAVYFDWDNDQRCIAVDAFTRAEGNLRAIYWFIERCRMDHQRAGLMIVRTVLAGFRVPDSPTACLRHCERSSEL
jgi:hypothetical protein